LQRLLGKKTLEVEILKDALELAEDINVWPAPSARGFYGVLISVCVNVYGLVSTLTAKMDIRAFRAP
jgi:hypothetical protein